jgi:uncharacterized protein YfcZ (UPF0381/DUF406 family)
VKEYPPLIDTDLKEFIDTVKKNMVKDAIFESSEKLKQALIDLTYSERRAEMDENQYLGEIIQMTQATSLVTAFNFSLELLTHYHHFLMAKLELEKAYSNDHLHRE